jgi:hypothetical protein
MGNSLMNLRRYENVNFSLHFMFFIANENITDSDKMIVYL